MRAIVQVVSQAEVFVNKASVGACKDGLLLYVGVKVGDTEDAAVRLADRIVGMRIFPDKDGKINFSLNDLPKTEVCRVLAISNFTLFGNVWSSRRPNFTESEKFERAKQIFEYFVNELKKFEIPVDTGIFGENMEISSIAVGPTTIVVESEK